MKTTNKYVIILIQKIKVMLAYSFVYDKINIKERNDTAA